MATSAGYTVVGEMEQTRRGDARYQIGLGKVEELTKLVKEKNADKVIFDNPLRPLQTYNLAKATGVEVIDRFQLILEIFTRRASTTEAQMQIQLARLRYELSRAKEMVRLAKQGEQPGFMGLGAYEVDIYYESVKREVHAIRRKLKRPSTRRILHRERRKELGFKSVSLAGYTNAGKSSLFSALTEATAPVNAGLFTTLSTTTRFMSFLKQKILLTDTVGFIDRLPLTLIEAFHSTLEETIYSDLILLVVDVSEPVEMVNNKLSVCLETIERIGALGIPVVTVFNKIDLVPSNDLEQKLASLKDLATNEAVISALRKVNIETLRTEVLRILEDRVKAEFTVPINDGTMSFLSSVFKNADVQVAEYKGNTAHFAFASPPEFAEKVRNQVEKLKGQFKRTGDVG